MLGVVPARLATFAILRTSGDGVGVSEAARTVGQALALVEAPDWLVVRDEIKSVEAAMTLERAAGDVRIVNSVGPAPRHDLTEAALSAPKTSMTLTRRHRPGGDSPQRLSLSRTSS